MVKNELIVILPDGGIQRFPLEATDPFHNADLADKALKDWRETLSEQEAAAHEKAKTFGGVLMVKTLDKPYRGHPSETT